MRIITYYYETGLEMYDSNFTKKCHQKREDLQKYTKALIGILRNLSEEEKGEIEKFQ